MRKRAELVDQTRQRITEAAVRLHTTIGPAEASLSAVAEEAGVTRLTLYRHFATRDDLFAACMSHWRALHPRPDPDSWRVIPTLEGRARRALEELYGWYRENGDDLYPIYHDSAYTPEGSQKARVATDARVVDAVLDGTNLRGGARKRLRAAAGHIIGFWTWRSFVIEQGLTTQEAVDLAVAILMAAWRTERNAADGLVLRRATNEDAPAITELVAAAYGHYVERIGRLPKPMRADQRAAVRRHLVWILADTSSDQLAGVLEVIEAADHLFVENVAIAPQRQGSGLGRRLLDLAEDEARRRGFREVRLETNERFVENLALYRRRGYRETGRTPYLGTEVVQLTKTLGY